MKRPGTSRSRDNCAGFTLLEALIATAMMAMILTSLATITSQWLPNWNRGIARVQRSDQMGLGLDRLVTDLSAAEYVSLNRAMPGPLFDGTENSVTFVRTARVPNSLPSLEIVRLAQSTDKSEISLVRSYMPFVPSDEATLAVTKFKDPVVLLKGTFIISFSYAGSDRVWQETWQQAVMLPRAIKITLRDAATKTYLASSTATLVHATIPASCVTKKTIEECWNPKASEAADGKVSSNVGAGKIQ